MLVMTLLPVVCQAFATASCGFLISQIYQHTWQRLTEQTTIACDDQALESDTLEETRCTLISETLIITTSLPFLPLPRKHLSQISDKMIELPDNGFQADGHQGQFPLSLLGNTLSATYIETYLQQLVYQISPLYDHDCNRVRCCIHKALEETLEKYSQEAEHLAEPFPVSKINTADQAPLFISKYSKPTSDQLIFPTRDFANPKFTTLSLDRLM